ncbi:NUDIX domain-containing protein [Populibacterium corticicola]|uniref:NUDIX domain-containing protein n=1 Tax=Populibacterium corticicola TaxID=1812826 RepID=A0ABW5XCR9_9MICO
MIRDEIDPQPVTEASIVHEGRIFDLVRESVNLGEAGVVTREYIDHPGAVAVIALDDRERILLLRQYRQPVGAYLWEPPAGLLDIPGEPTQVAAARELYEEADLRADSWQVLVDYCTTPGGNNEAIRVFLARGLHEVSAAERHVREDEEIGMESRWVEIDDAVNLVLSGQIHNPSAVVGILAVSAARDRHWTTLRSVDEAFPFRRTQKVSERI